MSTQLRRTTARLLMAAGPMLVASCGGGEGGGATCSPGPRINSSPPLIATVGQQYAYWYEAPYFCFPWGVCNAVDPVLLPPGAGIDEVRDLVYWTPQASDANSSVAFSIASMPNPCGNRATQSWSVGVLPRPSIGSFSASKEFISPGESIVLVAVFEGSGTIDGIGPVTSGQEIATPALSVSTRFTLTVANSANVQTRQSIDIQVLGPPSIVSLTASPVTVSAGDLTRLSWTTTGDFSVARLEPGNIDVMGRSSIELGPTAPTIYVLNVSNPLGQSASASVQVHVVPRSIIHSFAVTPAATVLGGQVSLTAQFADGTGELLIIDHTSVLSASPIASGETVTTAPLFRSTTFQLNVVNAVGQRSFRQIFVPITGPGTFQPTLGQPRLPNRSGHTATRLSDGRVFIAGDARTSTQTETFGRTTEIYDPATETFSAGPSLREPRSEHAAALLPDGRVVLIGGRRTELSGNGTFTTVIRNAEIFDPATGTMSPGGTFPALFTLARPRAATLPDGRVLVVTGGSTSGAFIYNPTSRTFSPFSLQAAGHRCLDVQPIVNGNALVIESVGNLASEIFSGVSNQFFFGGLARPERGCSSFATAALHDGRVLLVGGDSSSLPAEVYDPATGSFVVAGLPYSPSGRPTATTLLSGLVFVKSSGGAELFDPFSGTFAQTGDTRQGRFSSSATLLQDGRVLVVGGCQQRPPCEAELYTPM